MEASARKIYSQACTQVQNLKTMVEELRQTCVQQFGSIQRLESEILDVRSQLRQQISIDESQQTRMAEITHSKNEEYERILSQRDAEISRLMGLASQLPDRDVLSVAVSV